MRYACLDILDDRPLEGLDAYAATQSLDMLHLRYRRSESLPIDGDSPLRFPDFAAGFPGHLRQLSKTLYLEPQFCVFADAGWGDAYGTVERIASEFVDAGNGELLISAVRGSNLLAMLDYLKQDGVDFAHSETGEPWLDAERTLVAADLQIGAGPLQTALAEGARLIVAGCVDDAAPWIAAAVNRFGWNWNDYSLLASAAASATLAQRPLTVTPVAHTLLAGATPIELDEQGVILLNHEYHQLAPELEQNQQRCAEVECDWSEMVKNKTTGSGLKITGIRGAATNARWNLNMIYLQGYRAEGLLEFTLPNEPTPEVAVKFLTKQLSGLVEADVDVSCQPLVNPAEQRTDSPAPSELTLLLLVEATAKDRRHCQHWASVATQFLHRFGAAARWHGAAPRVTACLQHWPTHLPRESIDIAVDTRPASQWV